MVRRAPKRGLAITAGVIALALLPRVGSAAAIEMTWGGPGPANWAGDLSPIEASDWSYDLAAHLLERAAFGGTPEEIARLAAMTPEEAVRFLVRREGVDNSRLPAYEESPVWDPTLANFPKSRVAATAEAYEKGESMGVKVKPTGNRRLQPVVDRFFYWLRATSLESRRLANWWAERMLVTNRPLEEKMALFWHGHFATGSNKIRDYRKMAVQLDTFHDHGLGSFRDLLVKVAQDPAMLAYLDAGENVKGAPNENFGREVMELFTMGVGNYAEQDIREAARAFTGWTSDDLTLQFVVHPEKHDETDKTFLGRTGNYDGTDILNIILEQPVTAEFVAAKIYRYFVREDMSVDMRQTLGDSFREGDYEIAPLMEQILLSRDFYSEPSFATRIKGPVELVVSTYKKLGLTELPGIPDFNSVTRELGQRLLNPPTVAGWAQGRSWITPASLLQRGNFARDVLIPNMIHFQEPMFNPGAGDRAVYQRFRDGMDYTPATLGKQAGQPMNMADQVALQEDFNTRVSGAIAFREAAERVIPIPRTSPKLNFTALAKAQGLKTSQEAVDYFLRRFLLVPPSPEVRQALVTFLDTQLGTNDLEASYSYAEDPLRLLVHLIMSTPEYQLG